MPSALTDLNGRAVVILTFLALGLGGCGSGTHRATAGRRPITRSASAATTTSTVPAGSALPDGAPPPSGIAACTDRTLTVQSASGVPLDDGRGLFVRIFNKGPKCWLTGRPGVSLRDEAGAWHDFTFDTATGPATNGPPWTGVFDPSLVGVVVLGQAERGSEPPTRYTSLRLVLPNGGGTLDYDGIDVTLDSRRLTVHDVEADSQDQ